MGSSSNSTLPRHIVAVPYPGRGHINPLMNLCKILISRTNPQRLLVTFVVTEEWLGFIGSEDKPAGIRYATIPNVLPSELGRAADMVSFVRATQTKMTAPFERLLDEMETPVTVIVADTFLQWAVDVGNRRNIPVASFWPMSATVFTVFYHFDLLVGNGHFPFDLSERGEERVEYIPGISSIRLADLPTILHDKDNKLIQLAIGVLPRVKQAQYLLFTSIFEFESQVIDDLQKKFPFPVYSFGPLIPYFNLSRNGSLPASRPEHEYREWLDSQPPNSVFYVSLGSFLSVSRAQLDEIAAGLRDSGVRYLWVARGDACGYRSECGCTGKIVEWCEQLKVLCHPAVGGFWTHCGWSSTMEGVFAGKPMLTLPIFMDQSTNSKFVFEDWKIGREVRREIGKEDLLRREDIAELVKMFMDSENEKRKDMVNRAKELGAISQTAVSAGGSSDKNFNSLLSNILGS